MTTRIVHFVFGLRQQDEPFHLLHYLAIESCRRVVQPDIIMLHLDQLPYGIYWDLARPLVELHRIQLIHAVEMVPLDDFVARYRYAHHSDVVRLDVLAEHGGMYADIDTIFVRPVRDDLWQADAVIGREADVGDPETGMAVASLSNALVMAQPDAPFIVEWRERIIDAMDGSWSAHSCGLATKLAAEKPGDIHIEPQSSFAPFAHTPSGMADLLERPLVPAQLDETFSVHLCAHLWWEQDRTDFARFSAAAATENHIRSAATPLAVAARPFLPDHGLF